MRAGWVGGVALAVSLAVSGVASAADITKGQCVDANTYGQTLRREGKLSAASGQFQLCNDAKCPDIVRTDCTQRLDEVEAAFPTIVFDVKKADGSDVVDVKVMVDGKVLAEKMDGTALHVDPGSHEFSFEIPGEKALIRTFVLKEGEKARRERILLVGEGTPTGEKKPEPAKPAPAAAASGGNGDLMRYGGIGLAAAGVIGIGVGAFFGLKASSKWDDQQTHCKSTLDCLNHAQALSDHDGAVKYGGFSTIGFIAGGLLLAGGAALFLLAPKSDAPKTGLRDPLLFTF